MAAQTKVTPVPEASERGRDFSDVHPEYVARLREALELAEENPTRAYVLASRIEMEATHLRDTSGYDEARLAGTKVIAAARTIMNHAKTSGAFRR